jgi:hypothetical protein
MGPRNCNIQVAALKLPRAFHFFFVSGAAGVSMVA